MANPTTTTTTTTTHSAAKRRKLSDDHHSLLPRLPDHVAHLCLSLLPPSTVFSVCRSWRRLLYSAAFPPFRSLYTLSLPTAAAATAAAATDAGGGCHQTLKLSSFDPISSKWTAVDSPPSLRRLSLRHPSFISRNLPIQSLSVAGKLLLLAATTTTTSDHHHLHPAFQHPLVFNPLTATWSAGPPLSAARRWCAAGAFQETAIVASGIGSRYTQNVATTVEKWVLRKDESWDVKIDESWKKMRSLTNVKLSRDAIDAVGWKGKLLMVNVKGDYAKEGFVYTIDSDEWAAMPEGMLGGWKGPAAAMEEEEELYVVDGSKGVLKRYDEGGDRWSEVVVDGRLKGAEYVAAGGGKVCVVCGKDVGILVVDVAAAAVLPPRVWVVETPVGDEILGLHILPRMCSSKVWSSEMEELELEAK